jgi:hypothetical protein
MFCRSCGTQNHENAYRCVQCGTVLQTLSPPPAQRVENYLVLAIVATVCCCMPIGLVGVVHAAQVNARAQLGDLAGAQECARKARLWSLAGIGIGLVVTGLYVAIGVLAGIADATAR